MHHKGFSLIEVVLALAVVGGVLVFLTNGLFFATTSLATLYPTAQVRLSAQECLTAVNWVRDANGYDALTLGTWGLLLSGGQWQLTSPSDALGQPFVRLVTISDYGDGLKQIQCTVTWQGTLVTRTQTLTTLLSNR